MDLSLRLPERSKPLTLRSIVRWSNAERIGVEFVNPGPIERARLESLFERQESANKAQSTSGLESIGFLAERQWNVRDLAAFASAIETLYRALHAASVRRALEENLLAASQDPQFRDFLHDYILLKQRASSLPDHVSDLRLKTSQLPKHTEIYHHLDHYTHPQERLCLGEVRIASSGILNLRGLAVVIKQLRKILEDLWHRDSHEASMAHVEIAESRLRAHRFLDAYPESIREEMVKAIHELSELRSNGKVALLISKFEKDELSE